MIVKNSADTIRLCLQSVSGVVDQIVVADTGCTDNTCDIASSFGATIIQVPWQNHFADARNAALLAMKTDWVLVLDADEELDAEARNTLPSLLTADGVGGYQVPIKEYVPFVGGSAWTFVIVRNDSGLERARVAPGYFVNQLCRLFRRRDDIYFTGRVHEIVQPQIQAAGLLLIMAPFCIHHFGHLAHAESKAKKILFYSDLLRKRLEEDPRNVTTLSLCAMDALEVHNKPLEALRYLEKALLVMPNALEPLLLAAKVLSILERHEDALVVLNAAGAGDHYAHFLHTLRGNAHNALGHLDEAYSAYSHALSYTPDDRVMQSKLDYIEVLRGQSAEAVARLALNAAALPESVEVHELLVNAYIHTKRIPEAADEAERYGRVDPQESFLLKAVALRGQLRQWSRVEILAKECVALFPNSVEGHRLLMMAHVAQGRLSAASAEAELLIPLAHEPGSFLRAAALYKQDDKLDQMKTCVARGLVFFPASDALRNAGLEMNLVEHRR